MLLFVAFLPGSGWAEAVKAVKKYLTNKSVPPNRVYADGKGETQPVTKPKDCRGKRGQKALIACVQPDRRIDIEVRGTK